MTVGIAVSESAGLLRPKVVGLRSVCLSSEVQGKAFALGNCLGCEVLTAVVLSLMKGCNLGEWGLAGRLACIGLSGALEVGVRVGSAGLDTAEGDYTGDGWHD